MERAPDSNLLVFDPSNPVCEASWVLGLLPLDELPELAASFMVEGHESDAILKLSICEIDDPECIRKLFQRVLIESGGGAMSKIEALKLFAQHVSRSILSGRVSPLDGARKIWRATVASGEQDFHELDEFIYAASELDDRPEDNELFVNAILNVACRWAKESADKSPQPKDGPE